MGQFPQIFSGSSSLLAGEVVVLQLLLRQLQLIASRFLLVVILMLLGVAVNLVIIVVGGTCSDFILQLMDIHCLNAVTGSSSTTGRPQFPISSSEVGNI